MNTGPGAAGLLWLWAMVAELGPSDPAEWRLSHSSPPPLVSRNSRPEPR